MSDRKQEDLLTPEQRRHVEACRAAMPELCSILDKFAPKPEPPTPRLSELPSIWRHRLKASCPLPSDMEECADELDAASERDRKERSKATHAIRVRVESLLMANGMTAARSDSASRQVIAITLELLP